MSSPSSSAPRRARMAMARAALCTLGFLGVMGLGVATTTDTAEAQFSNRARAVGPGPGRMPPSRGGGFGRGPGIGIIGLPIGILQPRPEQGVVYEEYEPSPRRRAHSTARRAPKRSRPPVQQAARRNSGAPPAGETRFVPDEIVLRMRSGTSQATIASVARRFRLTRLETQNFQLIGETWHRWRIPDRRSVPTVIRALERDARITSAQPNYLYALQQDSQPNLKQDAQQELQQGSQGVQSKQPAASPQQSSLEQYTLAKMHAPEAQAVARGDGVLVGVIDSGIDQAQPELAGTVVDSLDTLETKEGPHAHGTAIAGAIAAHDRLRGTAPDAHILAVQAFGTSGRSADATTFSILKGIDWVAGKGARVINMSFAGPSDPAIESELSAAHAKNIVLIAAAGNLGAKAPPQYPAAYRTVIAVSATDVHDDVFSLSNRGAYIAVTAPGVDILVAAPNANYQLLSGTSFSAAHVSGAAALLLQNKPSMTAGEVRKVLMSTAHDLGPKGRDPNFGAGLVDEYAAVTAVMPKPVDTAAKGSAMTPAGR